MNNSGFIVDFMEYTYQNYSSEDVDIYYQDILCKVIGFEKTYDILQSLIKSKRMTSTAKYMRLRIYLHLRYVRKHFGVT